MSFSVGDHGEMQVLGSDLLNFGEAFSTQFHDCLPLGFRIGRVIYLSDAHDDDDDHADDGDEYKDVSGEGSGRVEDKMETLIAASEAPASLRLMKNSSGKARLHLRLWH